MHKVLLERMLVPIFSPLWIQLLELQSNERLYWKIRFSLFFFECMLKTLTKKLQSMVNKLRIENEKKDRSGHKKLFGMDRKNQLIYYSGMKSVLVFRWQISCIRRKKNTATQLY